MNPWPYPAGDIVPELHAALPPGDDGRWPGPDALAPELVGSSGGNGILAVEELNVQRTNWKKRTHGATTIAQTLICRMTFNQSIERSGWSAFSSKRLSWKWLFIEWLPTKSSITLDAEVLQKFCLQFWKLETIVHSMNKPFDEKPFRWKGTSMKRHSTMVSNSDLRKIENCY